MASREAGGQRPEEALVVPSAPAVIAVRAAGSIARPSSSSTTTHSYRDRRAKKGDFRAPWIQRINAGARANGMTYNRFIQGPRRRDRRRPSYARRFAVNDEVVFAALVAIAKANVLAAADAEAGA